MFAVVHTLIYTHGTIYFHGMKTENEQKAVSLVKVVQDHISSYCDEFCWVMYAIYIYTVKLVINLLPMEF